MSAPNMFSGLNLADLTALLQARAASNPAAVTAVPCHAAARLLAGVPTPNASSAAVVAAAAAARAPDPPGCRGEEPSLAAAVSALSGKRAAASLFAAEQQLQHAEAIVKRARRLRSWDEMFGALVNFHARHGTTSVPLNYPEDPELGLWAENQRRRKLLLSPEEKYKLDLIGFQWDSFTPFLGGNSAFVNTTIANPALESAFASLTRHQVPATVINSATGPSFALARNIFDSLDQYRDRIHTPAVAAALPANPLLAGIQKEAPNKMKDDPQKQQWNLMFRKLKAFHALHNHCDVKVLQGLDLPLCAWVMQQKDLHLRGTLPLEHQVQLESLGVLGEATTISSVPAATPAPADAKPTDTNGGDVAQTQKAEDPSSNAQQQEDNSKKRVRTFDENFKALLEYKKIHGNVDVPQKYDKDRKLGIWVKNVRQHPQRHSQEQRDRLDSIGFKWRKLQLDEQWTDAFEQLLEYKENYGDCNVPSRWKKCPALARWVHTQRTMYRRNKLLDDRKEKLEDAGFVWDCNAMRDDEAFHENYEKLVEFKKARGHCNVPNKYRRDRPLGRWAAKMRDLYCYDQLDADRRKALNDIGFVWKPSEEGVGHIEAKMKGQITTPGHHDEEVDSDNDSEGEE